MADVALPGDLNGDGFDDFIIGAGSDVRVPGRADVYFGGPMADAVADLPLYGEYPSDHFGSAVAWAGDLNADGYPDLVVGAHQRDALGPTTGRAYIYFGGPGFDATPDLVLAGATPWEEFGTSVACIGDANGDGYDDLVVGAPAHKVLLPQDGRAYIFFGGPLLDATPDAILEGRDGERLGQTVAGFGDTNGDGRAEFAVGADAGEAGSLEDAGRVYVCSVDPGGGIAAQPLYGTFRYGHFGEALASGDVNGDGHTDLLVAAAHANSNTGRVYVYYGGPGFDTTADLQLVGPIPGQTFGTSLAGGADLNRDGFGDLVVGAPRAASMVPARIYVFFGGPAIDPSPDWILESDNASEFYGYRVAARSGSDVNLDGRDDLLASTNGSAWLALTPCVTVASDPLLTVATGAAFELRYEISSDEDLPVELEYTLSDSGSWCSASSGALTLGAGASEVLATNCTAPDVPGPSLTTVASLELRLPACGGAHLLTRITSVTRRPVQPVLVCPPDVSVETNSPIQLNFSMSNPSVVDQTFDYSIRDTQGWCPVVYGQATLAPGATIVLVHACTVSGIPAPQVDIVTFTAHNSLSNWEDNDVPCTTEIQSSPCLKVLCPPDTTISPGETFDRSFRIRNCSDVPGVFNYVLADDRGWGAPLSGTVAIEGNGSAWIDGRYTAPSGVQCVTTDVLRFVAWTQGTTNPLFTCTSLLFAGPRPRTRLDLTLSGGAAEPGFGIATAMPGDLNADGHDDWVVSGTSFDSEGGSFPGRVYVYFGGPTADAIPDVVLTGETNGERFGCAVAPAGDLNSDGHPDLAVGACRFGQPAANSGRAYVFFGGPGFDAVPDFVVSGIVSGEQFGTALEGVGDVDADGHDDLIVGARYASAGGSSAGRAYVFFGGPTLATSPPLILDGQPGEEFGVSVARAGDLNGDGQADFLVGAQGDHYISGIGDVFGRVYVFFGGPNLDASADLVLPGSNRTEHFGLGLEAADVNGDGHPDILVGAPQADGGGRVAIYSGGPGIDSQPDLEVVAGFVGESFGSFVSGGADLDRDGFADFVVGAPGDPSKDLGRVYLFHGGPTLDGTCDGVLGGETAGDQYGSSGTATGADLDADGTQDLLIGAFRSTASVSKPNASSTGRAYVYGGLYSIAVAVEEWSGGWHDGVVLLEWTLAGLTADERHSIRLQRAQDSAGPYVDRAVLPPEPRMRFADAEVEAGRVYWYRMLLDSEAGAVALGGPFQVSPTASPVRTALETPYEMSGGRVRIAYHLGPTAARVVVDVHDIAGRRVRRFDEGLRGPGAHALTWDERDAHGISVARGVYLVRLVAGPTDITRKIAVLRR